MATRTKKAETKAATTTAAKAAPETKTCLLYTSDAADE